MKDFAIDPQSNSFLRTNKGFRFTEDRLEYLAQKVRYAISLFWGEWYLNVNLGVPYIPKVGNKQEHRPLIESVLQERITDVEGVKRLAYFTSSFDSAKRTLSVKFTAETDAGVLERNWSWNTD
jgi:hypothetical protein